MSEEFMEWLPWNEEPQCTAGGSSVTPNARANQAAGTIPVRPTPYLLTGSWGTSCTRHSRSPFQTPHESSYLSTYSIKQAHMPSESASQSNSLTIITRRLTVELSWYQRRGDSGK